MAINITRRDLLKLAGGSVLGFLFTPVPWKTLDDLAIWTQTGPWVPKLPQGEPATRFSACPLCPAACGVRARCLGGQPVSLTGVAGHPLSHGGLCPLGLAAHHLAYHPQRVVQPLRLTRAHGQLQTTPLTLEQALAEIAPVLAEAKSSGEYVAVLDQQPGRMLSQRYQQFLGLFPRAAYLGNDGGEGATLTTLQSLCEQPYGPLGLDLENTATLLSFGAPLLEGWGTPGHINHLRRLQAENGNDRRLQLIQIEARQSRTALQSDTWLPIKPGSETALALGLAQVLISESWCDRRRLQQRADDFQCDGGRSFCDLVADFTPARVAAITGLHAEIIVATARQAAQHAPAIALGGSDPGAGPLGTMAELAIASLNVLLDSVGVTGGIVPRRALPVGEELQSAAALPITNIADLPERSVRVLFLDAAQSGYALPWQLLERKLIPETGCVISLSPYLTGLAQHANYVIPAPAPFEALQEGVTPGGAAVASFTISPPLLAAPATVVEPAELLNHLAAALALNWTSFTAADLLRQRVAALQQASRGRVFTFPEEQWQEVAAVGSAEQLWEIFASGACWQDETTPAARLPRLRLLGKSSENFERLRTAGASPPALQNQTAGSLLLLPFGWRGAVGNGQVSPVLSKIYQESGLHELANHAYLNPATGRSHGLESDGPALLQTPAGNLRVQLHLDRAVPPGVVQVAVAPLPNGSTNELNENVLALCALQADGTWRLTPAQVAKV
ncbi:molybdopterin-dependent oxidoreductase [candidate division KSB1 bacterium]|nr:molybdopterin-dependent oxidoreductase [bacterium]NUM66539.1 molybdopterin-dependent oxidoreductase [candidate division KSB1 bacterium]